MGINKEGIEVSQQEVFSTTDVCSSSPQPCLEYSQNLEQFYCETGTDPVLKPSTVYSNGGVRIRPFNGSSIYAPISQIDGGNN